MSILCQQSSLSLHKTPPLRKSQSPWAAPEKTGVFLWCACQCYWLTVWKRGRRNPRRTSRQHNYLIRRTGSRPPQLRWHPWWAMCMGWKGNHALTRWEHPAAARYLEEVLRQFPVVNTRAARTPLPSALTIDLRVPHRIRREDLPWKILVQKCYRVSIGFSGYQFQVLTGFRHPKLLGMMCHVYLNRG